MAMGVVRAVAALAAVSLLTACASRPLPDDVLGLNTVDLVKAMRCELRRAIIAYIAAEYATYEKSILDKYKDNLDYLAKAEKEITVPDFKSRMENIKYTNIGYDFTFDIKATSVSAANIDFLHTLSLGRVNLGMSSESDVHRANKRDFRIVETYDDLLDKKKPVCDLKYTTTDIYPISGDLRLDNTVFSFFELTKQGLLGNDELNKPPTFADVIEFSTKLKGGATGGVALTPVSRHGFAFSGNNLSSKLGREDIHRVLLVMVMPLERYELIQLPGAPEGVGAQGAPDSKSTTPPRQKTPARRRVYRTRPQGVPSAAQAVEQELDWQQRSLGLERIERAITR